MKATIISIIITLLVSVTARLILDFEFQFRSYFFGLCVMWFYMILENIFKMEINNIKFKEREKMKKNRINFFTNIFYA